MIERVFGEVLKEVRTEKKMSQEALAFASELDRTYISMLERGVRQPSLNSLFKIASALKISVTDLINRVEQRLNTTSNPNDQ